MAMAIDSREPVSSSITSTRGRSNAVIGVILAHSGQVPIGWRAMLPTAGPVADRPRVLEGTLERVVYANEENAWSVVRLAVAGQREPVTAVGNLLGVQPGESLRLEGEWTADPKYGRQFRVASYRTVAPATVEGIERYLGSGLIRGIGKVMASRLVARFGLQTLGVIDHQPDRLGG